MTDDALKTTTMLLSETTLVSQTTTSSPLVNASYLCPPCRLHWLNRPCFDTLNGLVGAWNDLHVCLPAGKTLIWLTDRIMSWQAKTHNDLVISGEQSTKNMNTGGLV